MRPPGGAWRHTAAAVAVAGVEVWLYREYAALGTEYHFWLHLLLGGWLGLTALAAVELLRGRLRSVRPFEAGFLGHAWSAVPDVLFVVAGLLHARWMDGFALHVTAHFLWPNALVAGSALWVLACATLACARTGRTRAAGALLVVSALLLGAGVALRAPLPSSLEEVRQGQPRVLLEALPGGPWLCRVPAVLAG